MNKVYRYTIPAILLGALLLAMVAFYNGYPLVFGDSASYIGSHDPRRTHWARPVFYSLFLLPFHLELSLWPAMAAQCLLMAHLIWLTQRVLCGHVNLAAYGLLMLWLTLCSDLPWLTAWIMPDIMTPLVVIGLYLLGFCRDRLSRYERLYLMLLTSLAIASHLSHLPLAAGLILMILLLRRLMFGWATGWRFSLKLCLPLLAAVTAHLAVNGFVRHEFVLSPAAPLFTLARLIADGPARQYLADHCAGQPYKLCAYQAGMPTDADAFLWDYESPFYKLGQAALIPEARQIVWGAVTEHPWEIIRQFLGRGVQQLFSVHTGGELNIIYNRDEPISQTIEKFFGGEYQQYLSSRQENGQLHLEQIWRWQRLALWAALVVDAGLAGLFIRRETNPRIPSPQRGEGIMSIPAIASPQTWLAFIVLIISAMLINAVITGGLSGVHDRYESRLVWLFLLYAGLGVIAFCARVSFLWSQTYAPALESGGLARRWHRLRLLR